MGIGIKDNNPLIVVAFQAALRHQMLAVLGLLLLVVAVWMALQIAHTLKVANRTGSEPGTGLPAAATSEPVARRVARISFGLLWILDGALQAQSAMPIALPSSVVKPAAASSPEWVKHLVGIGVTVWSNHPVTAAVATVWIQVGIGAWLLLAPRGRWSRLGGFVSIGWGLAVWTFGEAFGGVFGSGLSLLFGAPGAVLIYVLAGLLVALPERSWNSERLGRLLLRGTGLFFVGMALLQAWPGRGFWRGSIDGRPAGAITAMVSQMVHTPQPSVLARLAGDFASFSASHGFAVNLVAVVVMAVVGIGLVVRVRAANRIAMVAALVFCLADWVLIEDLGVLGGTGTDPNSMIPLALIVVTGYLAVGRSALGGATETPGGAVAGDRRFTGLTPAYVSRLLGVSFAGLVTLLGVAPMAVAVAQANASPIVTEALNGQPGPSDTPAPPFTLTSAAGSTVRLSNLAGKVVVLTFLDPVCVADCPLIAQELRLTDQMLGAAARHVEFVAIAENPVDYSRPFLLAFDRAEGMDHLGNWQYVTGPLPVLRHIWASYGVTVLNLPAGAMVAHSDMAYVIDPTGRIRWTFEADPGSGSSSLQSSFGGLLASKIHQVLRHP